MARKPCGNTGSPECIATLKYTDFLKKKLFILIEG